MGEIRQNVSIVGPFPPPYGGMAVQAKKLAALLRESGCVVQEIKTNSNIPPRLLISSRIPVFRSLANIGFFLLNLHKALRKTNVVYLLTGFFDFFFWITFPALILIKIHKKRVILSARGGKAQDFFEKYKPVIKSILKQVDVITTPSSFLREAFVKVLQLNPIVIPNVADLTQFTFKQRNIFSPKLLVTRSLEEIYDIDCVIRAFKTVHDRFPDARLGIVGDGEERKHLEHLASRLKLDDCVVFHGSIKHDEIQDLYAQYDIFVNASRFDNFPGSILEAFASGLPVVTTKAGGIPYMVEDGVTGLVVDVGNCAGLAENVLKLIQQPELGRSMAQNARKKCERYSSENIRTLLLPILET